MLPPYCLPCPYPRSRLPPHPEQLPDRGEPPSLEAYICPRGPRNTFALMVTDAPRDDEDSEEVEEDEEEGEEEEEEGAEEEGEKEKKGAKKEEKGGEKKGKEGGKEEEEDDDDEDEDDEGDEGESDDDEEVGGVGGGGEEEGEAHGSVQGLLRMQRSGWALAKHVSS